MLNLKRIRRALIMPILKSIRRSLNIIKRYAFPNYKETSSVYDLYREEQIKKCYDHFKNI